MLIVLSYTENVLDVMHGKQASNLVSEAFEMMSSHGSAEHNYYQL